MAETNELAVLAILGLLVEGQALRGGHRRRHRRAEPPHGAQAPRRAAPPGAVRGSITAAEAHVMVGEARDPFRRAIHGTLVLPPRVARLAAA